MITGSIGIPVPGKAVGPAAEADAEPAAPAPDHAAPGAETQRQIAALAAAPAPEKAVRAIEKSIRKSNGKIYEKYVKMMQKLM